MREKSFIYQVAMESLLCDLPEFVELLVQHGLNLKDFVTTQHLEQLYKMVGVKLLRETLYFNIPKTGICREFRSFMLNRFKFLAGI